MLYAIQFDDQIDFGAVEIDDVVVDNLLAFKTNGMR